MSDRFLEQRNIKFCGKLGKNASNTCSVLSEAYGREATNNSNVFELHKRFKEGHERVEDDERSGRPTSAEVRNLVHSDRRLSINQAYYVEILKRLRDAVRKKKA
jgi:hypothetical protein